MLLDQNSDRKFSASSWAVLAGTRFFLAAIVLIGHLNLFTSLPPVLKFFDLLGGRAAVLGFLVISGVSIGHSYKQQQEGYLARRFLRIYPLYFFAASLGVALIFILGASYKLPTSTLVSPGWKTGLANLFFLQGFLCITNPYNGPLWTISMEVFYYVLVPLFSKIKTHWLLGAIIVSMVLFSFFDRKWNLGYGAARFAWPWLIGFVYSTRGRVKEVGLLCALGTIAVVINRTDTGETLGWLLFVLVVAVVLSVSRIEISKKAQGVLNFLGEQSYPLYLFHFPIYLLLFHFFGVRNVWIFIAATGVIVAGLNYLLDHWLKRVFWKPLVRKITVPKPTQPLAA
jgi:peptidoglycan/LPS O-acetylase OafA/YrhL